MSARKPTKSELAAKRKRKESAARRTGEPLKPIDIWAASIVECYEALIRAGYGENRSRWYIEEQMRLPEWIINNPDHSPYEDEEEED
jgi:hypothetical protein